ncbi:MAG: pentapeptide repeat-containing protein [Synechococcales bacterium]|nr:pentapeptide repeat-containing protein [Synechococcales bacterium]
MTLTELQKTYQKDIRGRRFTQSTLPLDLAQAVAGQSRWSKGSATVLLFLVCWITTFLLCFLGAGIGFDSVSNSVVLSDSSFICGDPTESRFVLGVMVVWLVVLLTQTISRSIVALAIALTLATVVYGMLITTGTLSSSQGALLSFTITISLMWGLTFLTHILFRFAIATLDVLFSAPRLVKGLLIGLTAVSAVLGSLVSNGSSVTELECSYGTVPLWANGVAIATGLSWGLGMALAAWWLNHKWQVPWRSPDVFREWALAVGSWAGTSVYNLDLSRVNFQGAILANTDLRAEKLYRTCFQQATGLERARVDCRYLDLDNPKVQRLLTHATSRDRNFRDLCLQGAYLRDANMREFDLTDSNLIDADLQHTDLREAWLVRTEMVDADLGYADLRRANLTDANLTGTDFTGADLRDVHLVRAQSARANFKDADLTGVCIEDWSVSSQTKFVNVRCDYVYRKYRNGQPSDRYPIGRNFEPGEFAVLFHEPENELEIIFKGDDFSYTALSLAFDKLRNQEPDLQLKLNGIEHRGNLWVVKVVSQDPTVELTLEQRLSAVHQVSRHEQQLEASIKDSLHKNYEETKQRLLESEQLVKQLAGVSQSQAEALKELSKKSFGNSFFITGSTITNLTGSGNIEYTAAAQQVRDIVTYGTDRKQVAPIVKQFVQLVKQQQVATTSADQLELMQQLILAEAEADPTFRAYLLQEGQPIMQAMAGTPLVNVIQGAIAQLKNPPKN